MKYSYCDSRSLLVNQSGEILDWVSNNFSTLQNIIKLLLSMIRITYSYVVAAQIVKEQDMLSATLDAAAQCAKHLPFLEKAGCDFPFHIL